MHNPRFARRSARLLVGALAGAALAIAVPLAASAHVEVSPDAAPPGTTSRLTFSFSHGCDGSPTTALVITIPEGVGNTKPVVDATWRISRTLGSDGTPTEVTFTAVSPVESGLAASVALDVLLDEASDGKSLAFPVTQQCTEGATVWNEIPAAGADAHSVERPAPSIVVGASAPTDSEGHVTADAVASAVGDSAVDPGARALAVGGISLGVIGLGVGIFLAARRRAPHA